jgi:hypothetical protein
MSSGMARQALAPRGGGGDRIGYVQRLANIGYRLKFDEVRPQSGALALASVGR